MITPRVLKVAYCARRLGDDCQERFFSSLLSSYSGARGDMGKTNMSLIMCGKRMVPVPVVKYYADGASMCPRKLFDDISEYYETMRPEEIYALWDALREILGIVPAMDRVYLLQGLDGEPNRDQTMILLTRILYYAWQIDLCQYEYALA